MNVNIPTPQPSDVTLDVHGTGRRPCQPTGLRVSQPESANRKARVSQQEGASQPTGRRESANRKARVNQPGRRESANQEGASQPTRKARVSQPGHASANQVARQPTRSRASQPGCESANQAASQPTRLRVSQPGRGSDNQVPGGGGGKLLPDTGTSRSSHFLSRS